MSLFTWLNIYFYIRQLKVIWNVFSAKLKGPVCHTEEEQRSCKQQPLLMRLAAFPSELDAILAIKEKQKNSSEGFSWWIRCLRFAPNWFWRVEVIIAGRSDGSSNHLPSVFRVSRAFTNALYGLSSRWRCKINRFGKHSACRKLAQLQFSTGIKTKHRKIGKYHNVKQVSYNFILLPLSKSLRLHSLSRRWRTSSSEGFMKIYRAPCFNLNNAKLPMSKQRHSI